MGPNTGTTSATNTTLTFDDSATSALPENSTLPSNSTVVTKPVDYTGLDSFPSPAPSGPYGTPAPRGTSTLGDQFNGTSPNGTWSLYVVTDGAGDGAGSIAGGWSLTFTLGSEASTSTSVSGSPNPSFASNPDQAVTFTASVTTGSPATPVTSGTVDFTADGTTISGCGAAALDSSGQSYLRHQLLNRGRRGHPGAVQRYDLFRRKYGLRLLRKSITTPPWWHRTSSRTPGL